MKDKNIIRKKKYERKNEKIVEENILLNGRKKETKKQNEKKWENYN